MTYQQTSSALKKIPEILKDCLAVNDFVISNTILFEDDFLQSAQYTKDKKYIWSVKTKNQNWRAYLFPMERLKNGSINF